MMKMPVDVDVDVVGKLEFTYKKDDNHKLFKSLEENPNFGISEPQNYIPLYNYYFTLTKNNYNSIMLNHKLKLYEILSEEANNIFKCHITNEKIKDTRKVFLKFSPLLDPIKYLLGKYDITNTSLLKLPDFNSSNCNAKVKEYNNSAYVDSFFTYLSSKLLHEHGFVHGLDFYGSFLSMKTDFRINIVDDIDYLNESIFFRKNDKILYELEYCEIDDEDLKHDTRNYKKKLIFSTDDIVECDDKIILHLTDINDLTEIDMIVSEKNTNNNNLSELELINLEQPDFEKVSICSHNSTSSSCSSRTSNTSIETTDVAADADDDVAADADDDVADDWESEEYNEDDANIIAKIKKFPVQVIALECCENTLDQFISQQKITSEMWDSIVLQILFSLITFQNVFGLTHNDLHTNNIMYIETDKKYLFYKLNHVYYKVPTFGKLFKIIDYGRAIYKFRGQLLCSDSYHPEGDAASQYNTDPYYNDKKPRLEPNFSFDLCRLGCALYDYLIDEPKTKIVQIILDWVKDDKERNILYKKNGDERYLDFKLYKMIARTVNKHIPVNILNNPYFDKYIISKKNTKKIKEIMDLDAIPSYM